MKLGNLTQMSRVPRITHFDRYASTKSPCKHIRQLEGYPLYEFARLVMGTEPQLNPSSISNFIPCFVPFSFLRSPFHAPRSSFSSKHYLQNVTFSFWSLMRFVYLHIALGISSTPQPAHTNAISLNIFQIITRQVSFRKPSQPSYRASHVTTEI